MAKATPHIHGFTKTLLSETSSLTHPTYSTYLPVNAWAAHSPSPAFSTSSYCMNIQLIKERHHFLGSVRSLSVLFGLHVQHTGCLLPLTSTHVENKHLAWQGSINNMPSLCCPIVSAAAVFCLPFLSFVVAVCICTVFVCFYCTFLAVWIQRWKQVWRRWSGCGK